jgi:soluble cytochrome b562
MIRTARFIFVALVAVAPPTLLGCVPKRDVQLADIPKIEKMEDLMFAQANVADPQFKKIGRASYTDAEFAAFVDAGQKLQATAQKTRASFSKGAEFDQLAARLEDFARQLTTAAESRNASAASQALSDVKTTCKTCHKRFR